MKITEVRVREVAIPRIYRTHAADPKRLQPGEDHARSRYLILELRCDDGQVGLGEIADVGARMRPPSADETGELPGAQRPIHSDETAGVAAQFGSTSLRPGDDRMIPTREPEE